VKIVETRKSLEPCTESGWDAVDVLLEEGLTDEDIRTIGKAGGSFLYLTGLRRPFFKLESHTYVIKGILGDPFFRIAAHRDQIRDVVRRVIKDTAV
jgi:hypothetical protein